MKLLALKVQSIKYKVLATCYLLLATQNSVGVLPC
jgi:hypothetical protein